MTSRQIGRAIAVLGAALAAASAAAQAPQLTPAQRIDLVLDPGSVAEPQAAGAMTIARGTVAGRAVLVAATNPSVARGAIGAAESAGLAAMF